MIEILVQRNIAGHMRGDVVSVDPGDSRYAGHLEAGNVILLEPAPDADPAPPTGSPWVVPEEDYGDDDPRNDDYDEDSEG